MTAGGGDDGEGRGLGEIRAAVEGAPEVEPGPYDGDGRVVRLGAGRAARRSGPDRRGGSGPPSGSSDGRPTIHIEPGETANNCRAAIAALGADTARRPLDGVYARDRLLVRCCRVADLGEAAATRGGVTRSPEALVLTPVELPWLLTRLADVAQFTRFDARADRVVVADPRQRLAAAILAEAPWPGIPILRGVIAAPSLRPDGSIIQRPGYDPASGLLFHPGHEAFPPVPAEPTPDQVAAAKALIDGMVSTFPFVDEAARSVAIAACLTALVRRGLPTAPGFVFDAPKAGNGKGLLAHLPAWIAIGADPHLRPASENPGDEAKSLFAVLLEGPAIVIIDNLEHTLKSEMLCAMLTATVISDRILGQSKTASAPTNVTLLFSGNNLNIAGDLRRRMLTCRIDAKVEHPERRRFPGPPLKHWALEHRGELAIALLTLARAYFAAGEPRPDVPEFGSFEQWCRLVRYPLMHAGFGDPCLTLEAARKGDPVSRDLRALLLALHDAFQERAITANEAAGYDSPPLREALGPIASDKAGVINTRRLGNYLAKYRDRPEGGLRIEEAGERQGVNLWRVVKVGE